MRAADAVLNTQGIKDQVKLAVTGGEVSKSAGITGISLQYEVLDPELDEDVFRVLEGLAVDFAISQRYLVYVEKLKERGI